jgi:hypothetical protein
MKRVGSGCKDRTPSTTIYVKKKRGGETSERSKKTHGEEERGEGRRGKSTS